MRVDVVLLPADLQAGALEGRSAVVFDVLRATTSMTAALAAGARAIRIFGEIESARAARNAFDGPSLLSGEINTLPPTGFDLGNSPGTFTPERCNGNTLFMSTTNGTRAIIAARSASALFIAALVNINAAARAVVEVGLDVTLICSGSSGKISLEDLVGCGALITALNRTRPIIEESDTVAIARRLFETSRQDLPDLLRQGRGGHNIIRAGLEADIDFAARLDVFNVIGRVRGDPPAIMPNSIVV